ncbi:hypothetical protein AVEN_22290-1 [Araneus ventricosus]|uniref:Uncharacterized protein n=1 Tax=Araneus ventricosus TaxID=182803 RepID=A0A4Y2TNG6_ARAVE|nr:hypothetical protein AVEN_22290-1 [Araneus ventricosus]
MGDGVGQATLDDISRCQNVSYSDALSTQTFSTEYPPSSHYKHKEQGNTARKNLIFAEALKKKRSPAILLNPKGTAENKTPVEEILKKELSKPGSNIQNIKKVQNKGLVVFCDKEEDIFNLVTSITDKEALAAKIETKAPSKRHPSLIVYDIPNSTTEEELQQAIVDRLALPNSLKLRGKEKDTSHWVLEAQERSSKR